MIPEKNDTILLLANILNDARYLKTKLDIWGYTSTFGMSNLNLDEYRVSLVLIEFTFYSSPYNAGLMKKIRNWHNTLNTPVILFAASGHLSPQQSEFPFLTLSNDNLIREFIRMKTIEGMQVIDSDHFTRSLLRKEKEKDTIRDSFIEHKYFIDNVIYGLKEKVAILNSNAQIIQMSQGFKDLFAPQNEQNTNLLLEGISKENFEELQQLFIDFEKGKKKHARQTISYTDTRINQKSFKVYYTNLLNSNVKPCVLISVESANSTSFEKTSAGQKQWFSEVIEGLSEGLLKGTQQNLNSNIERILFLLPKITDVKRVIILLKSNDGKSFKLVQEWCSEKDYYTGIQTLEHIKEESYKTVFDILNDFGYEELNLFKQNKALLDIKEFSGFCKLLNLNSFVNIPIDNGVRVFGYLLLDLHTQDNSDFLPHQISGQLISEALAYKTEGLDKGMGTYAYDFLNFLPVPVFIKDFSHRWVLVNDSMLDFIGKTREEVIGKTDYDLFGADIADVFWETDELVLSEKVNFQNEEYISTDNGLKKIVVTNKSLFHTADNQDVIVSTIKDVTKLKQIEKDLRERTEHLRKSERKLKTLNSTKDRFFSIIAHDLKNPFNTLVGFSSILSEDLDTFDRAEIEEFVKIIYDAAQHGYKLLENLLDWARTQTGKFHFEPIVINIQYLIDECLGLLLRSAERKNIKIISKVNEPIYAFADSNMVEMVIRNLLSNAVKFTYTGGSIEIDVQSISEKELEIIVSDNGIGMSEGDIEKLFRIDVEFTKHGTDAETGTGLGLILCKEFIEKNNGKISVISHPGKGSTFKFTLPKNKEMIDYRNLS